MNYRRQLAELRSARARAIAKAVAEATRKHADLADARDAEIRRLHVQGVKPGAIAGGVGCGRGTVYEVLRPEKHEAYNARRRRHWHMYKGGRAA